MKISTEKLAYAKYGGDGLLFIARACWELDGGLGKGSYAC